MVTGGGKSITISVGTVQILGGLEAPANNEVAPVTRLLSTLVNAPLLRTLHRN